VRLPHLSRAAWAAIGAIVVLFVVWVSGQFRPDRGTTVTKEEAVELARGEVEFEPERTGVRFLRQGFRSDPVWLVSFTEPGTDLVVAVRIDARDGSVIEVSQSRE
jgi:hypothetical protein